MWKVIKESIFAYFTREILFSEQIRSDEILYWFPKMIKKEKNCKIGVFLHSYYANFLSGCGKTIKY
jgi:hypothetical protein